MARALGKYAGALLEVIHLFKYHGNVSAGEARGADDRPGQITIPLQLENTR